MTIALVGRAVAVLLLAITGIRAQAPAVSTTAATATGAVDPDAARLIDQVMSPFCPGIILTNCPTPAVDPFFMGQH